MNIWELYIYFENIHELKMIAIISWVAFVLIMFILLICNIKKATLKGLIASVAIIVIVNAIVATTFLFFGEDNELNDKLKDNVSIFYRDDYKEALHTMHKFNIKNDKHNIFLWEKMALETKSVILKAAIEQCSVDNQEHISNAKSQISKLKQYKSQSGMKLDDNEIKEFVIEENELDGQNGFKYCVVKKMKTIHDEETQKQTNAMMN